MNMYGNTLREISFSQILINEARVSGCPGAVNEELEALRGLEAEGKAEQAGAMLKSAVEKLSGGTDTVLFDAGGLPSVMVIVPAITGADMPEGIRLQGVHPAFRLGKKTLRRIYVSKYLNCLADGRAVSLPMSDPAGIPCFDEAVKSVKGKGAGWMPMPVTLRAALSLQCLKKGREVTGNTDRGRDYYRPEETGIRTQSGSVLTGSGPADWTHTGRPDGIWDLVGNLNEWDSGFRLADGQIQLMDTEAMMDPGCDYGRDSALWYALDPEGRRARPDAPETLHFAGGDGWVRLTDRKPEAATGNCAFSQVGTEPGLRAPEILKLAGLLPPAEGLSERLGWRWIRTEGETMPLSGGAFLITYHSGLFFMGVTKPRDADYRLSGVRSIYISEEDAREEEEG